jgi:hypothetical protein
VKAVFTTHELKRVGTATTMLVVCGTVVILAMTMMLGHYNSLAHAGPKAIVDGAVIALLMGQHGRWRCLWLMGTVYGLVLLLQVGVLYLLPVTVLAAGIGAIAGRIIAPMHRASAIVIAAVIYELLAGLGAPIKIYFGTSGRSEPFLWGIWFAEWPLRIAGAAAGVWMSRRWRNGGTNFDPPTIADRKLPRPRRLHTVSAWLALLMSIIACTLPLMIESIWILSGIAAIFAGYALLSGIRMGLVRASLGLLWGWLVFGLLSYAWNRDTGRVIDLWRSLVLRFAPLTLASMVLATSVRAAEMLHLLRRMGLPAAVLLPLASVLRSIPHARLTMRRSIDRLREQNKWNGPVSILRNPLMVLRALLIPHINRWGRELSDESSAIPPCDRSVDSATR